MAKPCPQVLGTFDEETCRYFLQQVGEDVVPCYPFSYGIEKVHAILLGEYGKSQVADAISVLHELLEDDRHASGIGDEGDIWRSWRYHWRHRNVSTSDSTADAGCHTELTKDNPLDPLSPRVGGFVLPPPTSRRARLIKSTNFLALHSQRLSQVAETVTASCEDTFLDLSLVYHAPIACQRSFLNKDLPEQQPLAAAITEEGVIEGTSVPWPGTRSRRSRVSHDWGNLFKSPQTPRRELAWEYAGRTQSKRLHTWRRASQQTDESCIADESDSAHESDIEEDKDSEQQFDEVSPRASSTYERDPLVVSFIMSPPSTTVSCRSCGLRGQSQHLQLLRLRQVLSSRYFELSPNSDHEEYASAVDMSVPYQNLQASAHEDHLKSLPPLRTDEPQNRRKTSFSGSNPALVYGNKYVDSDADSADLKADEAPGQGFQTQSQPRQEARTKKGSRQDVVFDDFDVEDCVPDEKERGQGNFYSIPSASGNRDEPADARRRSAPVTRRAANRLARLVDGTIFRPKSQEDHRLSNNTIENFSLDVGSNSRSSLKTSWIGTPQNRHLRHSWLQRVQSLFQNGLISKQCLPRNHKPKTSSAISRISITPFSHRAMSNSPDKLQPPNHSVNQLGLDGARDESDHSKPRSPLNLSKPLPPRPSNAIPQTPQSHRTRTPSFTHSQDTTNRPSTASSLSSKFSQASSQANFRTLTRRLVKPEMAVQLSDLSSFNESAVSLDPAKYDPLKSPQTPKS